MARGNFSRSQRALARRLVAIYTSQDQQSSLAVILGASSLDDLMSRIQAADSMSKQDTALIQQVVGFPAAGRAHAGRCCAISVPGSTGSSRRAAERDPIEGSSLPSGACTAPSVRSSTDDLAQQASRPRLPAPRESRRRRSSAPRRLRGGVRPAPPSGFSLQQRRGIAEQYLGVPYVLGGASPSGFDCSGLVMYVYAQVGVSLPHYTVAQYNYRTPSPCRGQLQPGDLVFFAGLGHVGIYVGGGQFIHAPHTGAVVRIDSLSGWYASEYDGAKRILG